MGRPHVVKCGAWRPKPLHSQQKKAVESLQKSTVEDEQKPVVKDEQKPVVEKQQETTVENLQKVAVKSSVKTEVNTVPDKLKKTPASRTHRIHTRSLGPVIEKKKKFDFLSGDGLVWMFKNFNKLYFDDEIKGFTLTWSVVVRARPGRVNLSTGEIVINRCLVKEAGRKYMEEMLLHQMIHAWLLCHFNCTQREAMRHGDDFYNKMKNINKCGNYHITANFQKNCNVHWSKRL